MITEDIKISHKIAVAALKAVNASTSIEKKEPFCNGLTQEQLLDWYYHLNTVSIPMYLKEKNTGL